MAAESRFASLSCFVSIFLTKELDFTKTIIRLTLIDSEPIRARGIVVEYAVIQILGSNFSLFLGIIMFYNEFGTKENRI